VLIYAPSGAGKSSMLNTVVANHLQGLGIEVMLGGRVAGALPENAKAAAIRNIFTYSLIYSFDSTATPHPNCRLADYLSSRSRPAQSHGRVVILDQFEEIFTHHLERFEDRADFLQDVVMALRADPSLRVVFAIRQEYLADIEPLADALPDDFRMQRFALKRLETSGAMEALTRPAAPYAEFAPGVAEEVIRQLNTIRVPGFDGVLVEKRGEYVEMVHLQIVCQRLWANLPRGCVRIEREHIQRAAGEGKAFEEFVVNALNAFYDDIVNDVANSAQTKEHGGFSADLIRLGCMKFVTPSATRTMVAQSHGRTGRLPDWIVAQLEGSHLLRAEQRGGERWYELSHDRLAQPISQQMDRKVSALLYALDLLAKVVGRTLDERPGAGLKGYFREHPDVLRECLPFSQQSGLFPDEAEFIFRASLCSAQDLQTWSDRLLKDYPAIWRSVLEDAVKYQPKRDVRKHAAMILASPGSGLEGELVRLALAEQDETVRKAAAESLTTLDTPALYDQIAAELHDPATRWRGRAALSAIRVCADQRGYRPGLESWYFRLSGADKAAIRLRAWQMRLREGLPAIPYLVVPAGILAAASAGLYKMLPSHFGWSLAQQSAGAGVGLFAGMIGGVVWGGGIALGLALYRVIFDRPAKKQTLLLPFGAIVTGVLSGFVTGVIMTFMCACIFEMHSLRAMGWVQTEFRFSPDFWRELFVSTRYGWGFVIMGTGLGIGMALMVNSFRASGRWRKLTDDRTRLTSFSELRAVFKSIVLMALPFAWPLPLALAAAAVPTVMLIHHLPPPPGIVIATRPTWECVVGDASSQAIGAFFGVCGMLLGVVMLRLGVQMSPRKDGL
jgi:hypothetical protein